MSKFNKHRRSVLTLLAIGVWLILCLPPLLKNQPDAFQASGSVIVIMAVLIYARERARRENEVVEAQRDQIVAILEEHETWGDYYTSQSKRDKIENEIKSLRLYQAIGQSSHKNVSIKNQITELEKQLDNNAEKHNRFLINMERSYEESKKTYKSAEKIVNSQAKTAKLFERLELALLTFGTLQWGYGDRWVEYLHSL